MSRLKLAAATMVATALVVSACGGGGDSAETSNEVTIQVIGHGSTVPKPDILKEELDAALGLDIRLSATDSEDAYYTQLTASLAGGNAPDLFEIDRGRLQDLINQGLVLDLTEYLDTDLKEYTTFVTKDAMKVSTFDGKVYGFSKRRPLYHYLSYWIRKDWLDKLGLQVPKTTDDLYTVAKAFTQGDPDGNGKPDTYGITGGTDVPPWTPLWAGFGGGGNQTGLNDFYVEDGKVVNGFYDPDTKTALAYINRLVGEKLVDPDTFSTPATQGHQRALQGKAGIIYTGWPQMTKPQFIEQYKKAQPTAEWIQINPPAGPGGHPGAIPKDPYASAIFAVPSSVKKDDKKLKQIFKLLNHVSTADGNRLVSYGVEGTHYTVDGGKITATDKLTSEGEYFWLYQFSGRVEDEYLAAKFPKAQAEIEFAESQPKLKIFKSLVVQPEGFKFADAKRYADEQIALFINGKRPLSEYDAFLEELSTRFAYQSYLDSASEQLNKLGVTG